jgi:hypothetical protein
MNDSVKPPHGDAEERKPARRLYRTPRLVSYGSVARLTQGGTGPAGDVMSHMAMVV